MSNRIIETIIIGFITSILGGIFLRVISSFFNKKDEYLNILINKNIIILQKQLDILNNNLVI